MATLKNCFECGKPISSSVSVCLHCHTNYPFGVSCRCCGKTLKRSQGTEQNFGSGRAIFHKNCYNAITSIDFQKAPSYLYSCPVCNKSYQYEIPVRDGSFDVKKRCDNCGHNIEIRDESPYRKCCFCPMYLNNKDSVQFTLFQMEYVEKSKSGEYGGSVDYTELEYKAHVRYAHKFCYEQPCNQNHIKEIEKHRSELIYKKEKNEFWSGMGNPIRTLIVNLILSLLILTGHWLGILLGLLCLALAVEMIFKITKYSR